MSSSYNMYQSTNTSPSLMMMGDIVVLAAFAATAASAINAPLLKALSHLDDLASVCQLMNFFSKTLAHIKYVIGKFW